MTTDQSQSIAAIYREFERALIDRRVLRYCDGSFLWDARRRMETHPDYDEREHHASVMRADQAVRATRELEIVAA